MKKHIILLATVAFLLPLVAEPLQANQQNNERSAFSFRENDVKYKNAEHNPPSVSSEPVGQSQNTNKGAVEKIVMSIFALPVIGYLSVKFISKAIHAFKSWRANPNLDNRKANKSSRVPKSHRPNSDSSSSSGFSPGWDSSGSGLALPRPTSVFDLEEPISLRRGMGPATISPSIAIDPVQVLVDAIVQPGNIHTPQGAFTVYERLLEKADDDSLVERAFKRLYGKKDWERRINEAMNKYAKHDKK